MQRLIRASFLPLVVSLWGRNKEDPKFLEKAATVLSQWDTTRAARQALETPAQAGPSKAKNTPSSSSIAPPRPFRGASPPDTTVFPQIVIDRSKQKSKSKQQAAQSDAAAAKAAPAREPFGQLEEETRRPKTFRELNEEDSSMEFDTPPSPKMQLSPAAKHKALPAQKPKSRAAAGKRRAAPTGELHETPCGNCERAAVDCMKEQGGGACVRCIKQKHKCDYSRARGGGKKGAKRKENFEASTNEDCNQHRLNIEIGGE